MSAIRSPNKISKKFTFPSMSKVKKTVPITHIFLNDKSLKSIPQLRYPQSVIVVYLQNNLMSEINSGLFGCRNLQVLYLVNNRIQKIQNLSNLRNLQKLYLSKNCISVVENLDQLRNLEELYIDNQQIRDIICFDLRTINTLKHSLRVLNISKNKIRSVYEIGMFYNLQVLDISTNSISSIDSCTIYLPKLLALNFRNNPIENDRGYYVKVFGSFPGLATLNGLEITENRKVFAQKFQNRKKLPPESSKDNLLLEKYPESIQRLVWSKMTSHPKMKFENTTGNGNYVEIRHILWDRICGLSK